MNTPRWIILILAVLGSLPAFAAGDSAQRNACSTTLTAGYMKLTLSGRDVAVWYPSTSPESAYTYNDQISGTVAQNAPVASCSKWPLVIFSHGYGGCQTQSVFITEQLARLGYMVAAPNHMDANCSGGQDSVIEEPLNDPQSWTDQTYVDRKNDMEATLDGMLSNSMFGPTIDSSKIAGMGHSLGGYTIFGMVGGWQSWLDPRIKVALLFSPYMDPYSAHGTVGNVKVPVMYQGGTLDVLITPHISDSGGDYDLTVQPKFLAVLNAAGHLAWTNVACKSSPTVQGCLQQPNPGLIDNYSDSFLDHYLNAADRQQLFTASPILSDYRRSTPFSAVSGASFQTGPLAPNSIGTLYGDGLTTGNNASSVFNLPTSLGGITVTITDQAGTKAKSPLYFTSGSQVNFVVPAGLVNGTAYVTITNNSGSTISTGTIEVRGVTPGLFVMNTQTKVPAAQYLQVTPDGTRNYGLVFDPSTLAAVPLNVSNGDLYLIFYATGIRGASTGSATATVGGVSAPILGLAAQSQYEGMDQISVGPLPTSLAGRGTVDVVLTAAGQQANTVQIKIQ